MNINEQVKFNYTGAVQTFVIPHSGKYRLQLWGAQGGGRGSGNNGNGGYATGTKVFKAGETISVYVGGFGNTGGWNGGGKAGYSSRYGGGATDIRYKGTELTNRIIVAGGGGSVGAANRHGGAGGGLNGISATGGYGTGGECGTQSSGGAGYSGNSSTKGKLGIGGNGVARSSGYGGAGGGGYYGGAGVYPDGSGDDDRGGGGGSSYIGGVDNGKTIAGNASMPNPDNLSANITGRQKDGVAIITLLEKYANVEINVNGTYKEGDVFINVNGTWKPAEVFVNSNGVWKS